MSIANETNRAISELKSILKRVYGERLHDVLLYGSQARGEAAKSSDIDVLVVLNGSVHPAAEIAHMGKDVAEISLKHDVVLSCFYLSKAHYLSEKSPLALNMRREAIAI